MVRKVTVRQPIPDNVLVELSPKHDKKCMFCGRKEISEKLYGILYQLNDVVVHYFCIVSTSPEYNFFIIKCITFYTYVFILMFKNELIFLFSYCLREPFKMEQIKKEFGDFY